jgi:phosphoglycolate phosphatase-like HAD superfamily hydrolase
MFGICLEPPMNFQDMLKKYKAFIFDFDGVVVDSLGIKAEAFGLLFEDLGPEVMAKVKAHHLRNGGVTRYEKFKIYYRQFMGCEITPQESETLDRRYSELVVRKVIEAEAIPGVMDVLRAIKDSGKFCCVLSATPEAEIRHIVKERQMGGFFCEVVGSPRSKKDNLGLILKRNKIVAPEAVYFGDATSDLEAAKAYGVDFVGVVGSEDGELSKISDIMIIKDFL